MRRSADLKRERETEDDDRFCLPPRQLSNLIKSL